MSLEVLKIIILACQVSGGGDKLVTSYTWERVDQYQAECQKKLIKCDAASYKHQADEAIRIRNCLLRR